LVAFNVHTEMLILSNADGLS